MALRISHILYYMSQTVRRSFSKEKFILYRNISKGVFHYIIYHVVERDTAIQKRLRLRLLYNLDSRMLL